MTGMHQRDGQKTDHQAHWLPSSIQTLSHQRLLIQLPGLDPLADTGVPAACSAALPGAPARPASLLLRELNREPMDCRMEGPQLSGNLAAISFMMFGSIRAAGAWRQLLLGKAPWMASHVSTIVAVMGSPRSETYMEKPPLSPLPSAYHLSLLPFLSLLLYLPLSRLPCLYPILASFFFLPFLPSIPYLSPHLP